ncbi:MAG: hypothetical protein Q4C42_08935 [Clostridia bacterium]|nr:hypothetical protein [Clostridia bacterium]
MARFIENGDLLINVDFVRTVRKINNKYIQVVMKDGEYYHLPMRFYDEFSGAGIIKQIIPVRNIYAIFNFNGRYMKESVPAFAVTGNGKIRPMYMNGNELVFMDNSSTFVGIDYSDMAIVKEGDLT